KAPQRSRSGRQKARDTVYPPCDAYRQFLFYIAYCLCPSAFSVGFPVISVRAMPAPAFTAITSFAVILLRKHFITFRRQVIISFFYRDNFFNQILKNRQDQYPDPANYLLEEHYFGTYLVIFTKIIF